MNFFDNYIINFEKARRKLIFLGNLVDCLCSPDLEFMVSNVGHMYCHNFSLELVTKVRGCKGEGQEGSPGVTFHAPDNVRECVKNEPSHSQVNSHVGNWSPDGLSNF
jgi:hypothetical protein